MIDYERLERVRNTPKILRERGDGSTFLLCFDAVKYLSENSQKHVAIVISRYDDIDYTLPMLRDIATELEIDLRRVRHGIIKSGSNLVKYFPENHFYKQSRGARYDKVFFMRHFD